MAWSDPKVWTADDLLTASDLNQYVSDNLSALYALIQGGGRKNLLHNGAMQIHQRGTSQAGITSTTTATGTTSGNGYWTADRWRTSPVNLGNWTQTVEDDAPTGSGFRKSLKMLLASGAESPNPAAGDYVLFNQYIEGQNLQSIKKGTADAQPLTLSFWVKSNKTGTYIVRFRDAANTRHVCASYTISASGTWEQKGITIPADTTGAFANDNTVGLDVQWWLASGSTYTSGTLATAWASATGADADVAVGQTNLADTNSNYWQITGVQLEVGSANTGFEHKSYGTELAECQRHYWRTGVGYQCISQVYTTTTAIGFFQHPVPMRAAVTAITTGAAGDYYVYNAAATPLTCSAAPTFLISGPYVTGVTFSVATGLVAGDAAIAGAPTSAGLIGFTADL